MTTCHKGVDWMPTETFFNLSDEKKSKILKAARDEFTEHELYKSRVSNIIKNAGIPRGSFYQYFEDLEDLYYYVIDEVFEEIFKEGQKYTKLTNDLFAFSVSSFEYDYDAYTNDKRHRFMMNVMKSISDNADYIEKHIRRRDEYILGVLEQMDLSKCRFKTNQELIKMYQMIQDVKRNVIQKSLLDNLPKEQAIKEIKWYIDILKNGLIEEE
jgi:AcrR family transcriptional regulator